MEVVAISTAKSALNSVVKTATTAITDELGFLLGVQEELFFIKEELEMMQSFLRVASTENVKSDVVTTWIKQVQELAFDVEDCLQEASVHLTKKSCLPVMGSVKKRDNIARKIRMLKTRIEDVSQRNLRYNLINKDNSGKTYNECVSVTSIANVALLVGLDEPKRILVELIRKGHGEVISVVGMGGLGKTTLIKEVYDCQELRDDFKRIAWVTVQHPFNIEEFIESLGKQIPSNSKDVLPKNPSNSEDVLPKKTMIEKVTEYLKDKKCMIVLDDLSSVSEWDKIKNVIPMGNGNRIIVTTRLRPLAESISHPSDIYEIKELSENDSFDLFYKAVYKTHNYFLESGEGSSSTEIIEENNEGQKQCIPITITKSMNTEAGLIIKSCGRLPLAIVTIGSYLATRPKTIYEWKTMHEHLSSELGNNPNLGVVNNVLTSSYEGLPYHLKPSLLYLSVFHNHKEIRRSRIIRRWMADGYVMEGRKKTAEEVGKSYFYDLMGRNLIQPSQMGTIVNGDVKRCNIHDLMYELILGKAVDENIVSVLEDKNLITMIDKVRHLVIAGEPSRADNVLERVKLSHMRSISVFGKVGDYLRYPRMKLVRVLDLEGTLDLYNPDLRSVGKLRHLKYLGLRGTNITKLLDSLGNLSELETLDIRNTIVDRLPTGLGKLHKLSYLRAGYDSYKNQDIWWLGISDRVWRKARIIKHWVRRGVEESSTTIRALPYLVTSACYFGCWRAINPCYSYFENVDEMRRNYRSFGVTVPRGIGELRSLNVLDMIDIGGSKRLAKELQNLTNLSKLAVRGFSKENGETLGKVIEGLQHLRSLVLSAVDDLGLGCCLDSVSSPPKYLKSLKLYSHLGKLPDSISSFENLEEIHLRNTELTGDIKAIEKLPNLKILHMLDGSFRGVKILCFGEGTFPMLHVMIIEKIFQLERVSFEKTALKRLEVLKISYSTFRSQERVLGLFFLLQLRVIEVGGFSFYNSNNEAYGIFVSNLQQSLSMHPSKPVLRVLQR